MIGPASRATADAEALDQRAVSGQALSHRPVCGPPAAGTARCHAEVVTDAGGAPLATVGPSNGYRPSDLGSAYRYPVAGGAWKWNGKTVAVIAAYDNPRAEADLAVYRSEFGLPPCTSSSGCFTKIDQWGGSRYPIADAGWAREIALDLDMVSAVCGHCKILLVEAASNGFADLTAAVNQAATLGASAISNSYGSSEFRGETTWESHYNHPGSAVTASAGDSGYGVQFPAASQYVTAVGGTRMLPAAEGRGWSEVAWVGTGSGCSAYIPKPAWQSDTRCSRRTVADVAAVADPLTGVAVYSSFGSTGDAHWYVLGGTSVGAPIIAGMYTLAANGASTYASSAYAQPGALFDITSGSNGVCRRAPYLCTAGAGYDGPTGMGTPNGVGAF